MSTLEGQVDTGRTTHLPQMHRQFAWKTPVRVATTANGTLSTAFDDGSTVDGVTLATGDRILVKNQTATEDNGIYIVQASGVPLRAYDLDNFLEVPGAIVLVGFGTANAGTIWYTVSEPAVLGDDAMVWTQFTGSGVDLSGIDFIVGTATGLLSAEIVAGTTPGGELGGTWGSPTVDATHSGSAHSSFVAKTDLIAVAFIIDGAGATITTGIKGDLSIPFGATITGWRLLADQTGAIVVNGWKDTYANYPPTVGDAMWSGSPPTITASDDQNEATGLSIAVTAGDTIRFNVDSVTSIQRVTLTIRLTRS